jgi:hypothetical protein
MFENAKHARWFSHLPLISILVVSSALGIRTVLLIQRYSVNVLYWDQWDFYEPLFDNAPLTSFFLWQNGPVRQGIGFLIYKYVAEWSRWNTRTEALAIAGVVCLSMVAAVYLKKRLFSSLGFADVCIPFLFLSPVLIGVYTIIPNPSHSAFPLLLTMLYCIAWTSRHPRKYIWIVLLNFLLIFTTFGLLMGAITPLLLAYELWRTKREALPRSFKGAALALFLSLASVAVFFKGYNFDPASDCFQSPHPRPVEYILYVTEMLSAFWRLSGFRAAATIGGLALFLILVGVLCYHVTLLLRPTNERTIYSLIVTILIVFSLLFAVNAAFGRVCLGVPSATGARYMVYLIPAFLGLYFHLLPAWRRHRFLAIAGFVVLSAATSLPLGSSGTAALNEYRRGKEAWKQCYLVIEHIEECNRNANFAIYPGHREQDRGYAALREKLTYLKNQKLNLYADNR